MDSENTNFVASIGPLNIANKFRYLLLPGQCPKSFPQIELHNRAFLYWRDFWNKVFAEISSNEYVNENDFFRQDIIAIILDGENIVGLHLYTAFNLTSTAAVSQAYFRNNYSIADIEKMKNLGAETVLSMEYMTVAPEYRKSAVGFATMDLIGGLAHEILKFTGHDAVIAPCRSDLKVDRLAAHYGAIPLGPQHIHHGVPVINMFNPVKNLKRHSDPKIAQSIDDLWGRRESYLNGSSIEANRRLSIAS